MADKLIGKKIGGYEIVARIGQGGMATVYRAQQVSMNRSVAIKVLPRHFLNDDTYLQRFTREVKIVSQLEHRSIVPVHDYGEDDGQPYIVMRYMSGGSVDDILRDGALPLARIIEILEQIAPALDYAHSKDVLHRDLKPSNVLMDDAGGAFLTDFGIARILGESGTAITADGVVGTPSYMSPEQAQGQPLDGRSDLYSLGVMLFEMATGRRPFVSDTPYSIAVMHVTKPPPLPRQFNPDLPPSVEAVILRMLSKNADERYATASAFIDALREAIANPHARLSDTQPAEVIPPSAYAAPVAYSPSPISPPQVYAPVIAPEPMMAVARVSPQRPPRKKGNNLLVSAVIGVMVGCGLLALVVAAAVMLIQRLRDQDTLPTLTETETIADIAPLSSTSPPDATATIDPTITLMPSRTSTGAEAPDLILSPPATSIFITPSPNAPLVPTPVTGVAPVGERTDNRPLDETISIADAPLFDSGVVVYYTERHGNFEIYRMDLATRAEHRLTNFQLDDMYPAVSPDGAMIAFQSDRDGDFDIFVMQSNGNNQRRVVQNRVVDSAPAWSPDGAWLVYASDTRNDGNFDIVRVRPNGDQREVLISDGKRNSTPHYSPDGRYIVYTCGAAHDAQTWEICRYNVASGEIVQLTDNAQKDWFPSVHPDGASILFLTEGRGYAAIATMAINGEEAQVLYDGAGYEFAPRFSPDGTYIIFSSDVSGRDEVYLLKIDDKTLEQLTTLGGIAGAWFPIPE